MVAITKAPSWPVVFYDGTCGLCHGAVAFLIARDAHARLRFAPLQGPTAATLLPQSARDAGPSGTLVLLEPGGTGRISVRSRAVLRALSRIGGPWTAAGWLEAIPGMIPLLDLGYALVARNRIRWFGRRSECPLPDAALRSRFLE